MTFDLLVLPKGNEIIANVAGIHPLGTMNIRLTLQGDSSRSC